MAMADKQATLRSGGASGADTSFEMGCDSHNGKKEIYLPWKGFNNNDSVLYDSPDDAYDISQQLHPRTLRKPATINLMARNVCQVLGYNLDKPSDFVVCWTPNGCITHNERIKDMKGSGGTGHAISVADMYGVPVYNLKRFDHYYRLCGYLKKHEDDINEIGE